jgi:hypothetical protein
MVLDVLPPEADDTLEIIHRSGNDKEPP